MSSSLGAAKDFHCPGCLAAVFTAPKTYLVSTPAAFAGTDQCRDCRSWPGKDRSEQRGGPEPVAQACSLIEIQFFKYIYILDIYIYINRGLVPLEQPD